MGGWFRYSCNRCEFRQTAHEGNLYVVCADSTEVVCGHPLEVEEAERATGCDWSQLKRKDRLRSRRAYLCLHCGETGYYGQHQGKWEGVTKGSVSATDVHRTDTLRCLACNHQSLHEMGKRTGTCLPCYLPMFAVIGTITGLIPWWSIAVGMLLGCLFFWLSTRQDDLLTCPKCKVGRLKCEMPMIS